MDKSNATFDSTLNSTFETTGFGSNSTKIIDESTADDDNEIEQENENENDNAEDESDTKDEPVEMVAGNDIVTESTEISNSTTMVK